MTTPGSGKTRPLEVAVDRCGGGTVVHLRGAATMDRLDDLRERLDAVASPPAGPLVVDLSELTFITSAGLGLLISAYVRCRRRGRPMHLVNPAPPIREILQVTRLTDLFSIVPTVDAAVHAV